MPISHIRIYDDSLARDLKLLAEAHRRTMNTEAMVAIESHLEANRATLRSGMKTKKNRA